MKAAQTNFDECGSINASRYQFNLVKPLRILCTEPLIHHMQKAMCMAHMMMMIYIRFGQLKNLEKF